MIAHFNYITVIGLFAGACTTVSLLPQLLKSIRTKETRDISLSMYVLLVIGLCLWIIYGIFIGSIPVILANSVSFSLAVIVLVIKIKYG